MANSPNEDREQRLLSETGMEESNLMTIEFLRARLLSERSVSKTARQRADELAKRVAELEEQLKCVSLQRKKAEKATADVLAILENHGISDVSEEFDSCSEQGESVHDFKARNGSSKETSTNMKVRKTEKDAYSSSEIESSPSTGRSLSWKSVKDSQHALEKKKYMDSVRRCASFSISSSSARRVGKSCRKIRRRETRSTEELQNDGFLLQNDGTEKAAYSRDASNHSDCEIAALPESSGYANGKNPLESPINGTQNVDGNYSSAHEKDEDMESALQHQEQLIGRYEEEEKAQREWEEKFRENNSGTQDSCDPGNHSDVTEERYETKSPEPLSAAGTLDSDNREMKQEPADACVSKEPQTSNSMLPVTDAEKRSVQDEKSSSAVISCQSSESEFSFPMSEKSDQEFSGKQHEASAVRYQQCPPAVSAIAHAPPKISYPASSSSIELALVAQDSSNSLGSVLEALQRAKLSLNQKLSSSSQITGRTSGNVVKPSNTEMNKVDSFEMPFSTPGLFRLPTDNQFEATTRAHPSTSLQPSFANFSPEIAPGRFLSEPFVKSRSAFPRDLFLTLNPQTRPGVPPPRSLSQPRLNEGSPDRMNYHLDPKKNNVIPSVRDSYPFLPDVTLGLPLNGEGTSRTFPISERGLPPVMRLCSYDEQAGPNMYR